MSSQVVKDAILQRCKSKEIAGFLMLGFDAQIILEFVKASVFYCRQSRIKFWKLQTAVGYSWLVDLSIWIAV